MNLDELKREAAAQAVAMVEPGMRLGLGTGSTAKHFVDLLAARMKREALGIIGVPTSEATRIQAASLGIPLTTLDETPELDLTIDGADEIDAKLRLIKGGGGAHLREKIVAMASKKMIVIADETKLVEILGKFPLPLEVVPFGLAATRLAITRAIEASGCRGELTIRKRATGEIWLTDSGNVILDAALGTIPAPEDLAERLDSVTALVEHGLFIGIAKTAILATSSGIKTMSV